MSRLPLSAVPLRGALTMFGYPFSHQDPLVEPPAAATPKYLPKTPPGFKVTAVSCVTCGDRCGPGADAIAKFLAIHGVHIREFLERHNTGRKPTWRRR